MKKIYPSLISANLLNLERVVIELTPHCDGFHVDVMDNHFVPNLTMGPTTVNALAEKSAKPLFVHLMVENVRIMINHLKLRADDLLAFHFEATTESEELIKLVKSKKLKAGIAISPGTKTSDIYHLLPDLDFVLVMSVEPGFSGQEFIPETIVKIEDLNQFRTDQQLSFRIAGDGGINTTNIVSLAQAGVDDFCIASAIFSNADPRAALADLYELLNK